MAKIGLGTKITDPTWIGETVEIGKNCRIQAFAFIPDNVKIGNDVFIGPHVCFTNDKYPPSRGKWKQDQPTVVEDGVRIGANVTILPSLILGTGCKIAAGSVVIHDVVKNTTVAGNPAHEIRSDW